MRLAGGTLAEIGLKLGISPEAVRKTLDIALAERVTDAADQLRAYELARIDAMTAGLWQSATTGDARSAEVLMKLGARRLELLGVQPLPPANDNEADAERKRGLAVCGDGGGGFGGETPAEYKNYSMASSSTKAKYAAAIPGHRNAIIRCCNINGLHVMLNGGGA